MSVRERIARVCWNRNDDHETAEAAATAPDSAVAVPGEESAANGLEETDTVSESPPDTVTVAETASDDVVILGL